MNQVVCKKVLNFVERVGGIKGLPPTQINQKTFDEGGKHIAHYLHSLTKEDPRECLYLTSSLEGEARWIVLLHEIIHATGHATRLCRSPFNLNDLSLQERAHWEYHRGYHMRCEELVADLGAWHLCQVLGLRCIWATNILTARIVRYCARFKWDHQELQRAKNHATQAAEYILR